MTHQNLRLVLSNIREALFKSFSNAGVQRASGFAQKSAVGRILYEGMLEQVSCMWWDALPEQQTGRNQIVECRAQVCLLAYH